MKANVLIIEDVKELNDLMAMYLTKEGMTVSQADSAERALELLANFTPNLVILDLNLPVMDGFEFLSKFRKTYETPVIIVSARDADEDIITGLGYGADEFVTKPFSPKVLTKSFPVPAGTTDIMLSLPAPARRMPFATSLIVPSPPYTMKCVSGRLMQVMYANRSASPTESVICRSSFFAGPSSSSAGEWPQPDTGLKICILFIDNLSFLETYIIHYYRRKINFFLLILKIYPYFLDKTVKMGYNMSVYPAHVL